VGEERRIAYVIATRAKDALYVSSLQNWGSSTVAPSRFLTGLNMGSGLGDSASLESDEDEVEEAFGGLFIG